MIDSMRDFVINLKPRNCCSASRIEDRKPKPPSRGERVNKFNMLCWKDSSLSHSLYKKRPLGIPQTGSGYSPKDGIFVTKYVNIDM